MVQQQWVVFIQECKLVLNKCNLVLYTCTDCIKAIPQLCNFYSLLERVYTFFGNSIENGNCFLEKEKLAPLLKGCVLQGGLVETTRLMQ
jgi:hypothetical protein